MRAQKNWNKDMDVFLLQEDENQIWMPAQDAAWL